MTGRADPWLRRLRGACRTGPSAVVGMALLLVVCAMALYGARFDGGDAFDIVSLPHLAPSLAGPFPLGTDYLGRDLAVCLLAGAAPTLGVAAAATCLAMVLGVALGAVAGYFGGRVDDFLMRVTEFFQVLPALLFAMVLVTLWSPSPTTIALTIGFVAWPPTARLTRAEFLRIRELEYVVAARAAGAGAGHVMWRVILPNAAPPLIVSATLVVTTAILFEAALSFLGLGDPDTMSWGQIIGANREYVLDAWWPVAFPGLAIFLTVLAVGLVGDGLNRILDPRSDGL